METPKLPINWCIKQNTDQIVCDWFNEKYKLNSQLNGNFKYITSDGWYCDDYNNKYSNYIEITFEQFKEHILKQKVINQKCNYKRLLFILKYIKNYER